MMDNRRTIALLTIGVLALVVLLVAATGAWAGPDEPGLAAPLAPLAPAAIVSDTISYQGRLLDSSGSPVDATTVMTFNLYADPSDVMPLWTQVSSVPVNDGYFSANLAVDPGHFDGRALWLGVWVEGDAEEMTPRQPLLAAPYALSLRPGAAISGTIPGVPTLNVVGQGIGIHIETTSSADPRDPALVGINLGNGPGLEGRSDNGFGVLGFGIEKPGIFGESINGTGGVFTSTYGHGVVVDGAGLDGLRIFANVAGDYIKAGSDGGLDFRVTNTGAVYANDGYNCALTDPNDSADDLTNDPCLKDDQAADFAEMMVASGDPVPGDVLVIDAEGRLVASTTPYASNVVGVHSTKPSYLGGGDKFGQEGYVPLAIVGLVPVKASAENGPIAPGDLLVASATPGHAMKAGPDLPVGTVIGKALEPLDAGTGVIQMLVTLQ